MCRVRRNSVPEGQQRFRYSTRLPLFNKETRLINSYRVKKKSRGGTPLMRTFFASSLKPAHSAPRTSLNSAHRHFASLLPQSPCGGLPLRCSVLKPGPTPSRTFSHLFLKFIPLR